MINQSNDNAERDIDVLMGDAEIRLQERFRDIDVVARQNQKKVLQAFWAERVSATDLSGSTGYGLDDAGRDKLESIYAQAFGAEAALVRPQIVSGTHAIRLALFGVLRPGDEIVFATGKPYDTLEGVIGLRQVSGSLTEWGVSHKLIPLAVNGSVDMPSVIRAIGNRTKVVFFQRSRGYAVRPALTISELERCFAEIRESAPHVTIMVDNCYGEFVEPLEPTAVGADVVMGSLIKNPGAGIMTTGGYVVGTRVAVDHAAEQLTAPGVGGEYGPTHDFLRPLYQSLFLAPHMVAQAVKGSLLASYVFEQLGLVVSPRWGEPRTDLILAVTFGDPEKLLAFCRAVQSTAPVDSFVRPEAGAMAGYDDPVIMAAGTFVQGGSLEMSADAPLRAPYIGYLQGGLTYEHVYLAVERMAAEIVRLQ